MGRFEIQKVFSPPVVQVGLGSLEYRHIFLNDGKTSLELLVGNDQWHQGTAKEELHHALRLRSHPNWL
jgi:hypothetical protein